MSGVREGECKKKERNDVLCMVPFLCYYEIVCAKIGNRRTSGLSIREELHEKTKIWLAGSHDIANHGGVGLCRREKAQRI